jgi:hypothetical protein
MKAISIRQPWCWMILHAGKDIENRDWPTRFRGTVLIHASKGMTRDEYFDCAETAVSIFQAGHPRPENMPPRLRPLKELERGGIVGQADIVDCVEASSSPWFFGRYGFVLRNAKPLPFRPFKGALGFFDVPEHEVTP